MDNEAFSRRLFKASYEQTLVIYFCGKLHSTLEQLTSFLLYTNHFGALNRVAFEAGTHVS